jgi:hypothetical protein
MMSTRMPKMRHHWDYFLAIERELEVLSRYVEFDERNFGCFSIEIARVLLAAGSEVDVICKHVCRQINPASTAESIKAYGDQMAAAYPGIPTFEVHCSTLRAFATPLGKMEHEGRRASMVDGSQQNCTSNSRIHGAS